MKTKSSPMKQGGVALVQKVGNGSLKGEMMKLLMVMICSTKISRK